MLGLTSASGVASILVVERSSAVSPGIYDLHVALHGSGARARIAIEDEIVAETAVSATTPLTIPIYVKGPTEKITIKSIPPIGQANALAMTADSFSIQLGSLAFTTRGTNVYGLDGKRFVGRGVNRGSLDATAQGWWLGYNDFTAMKSWGSNTVRVGLSAKFWLSGMCGYDPDYKLRIDNVVRWITGQGMVADLALMRKGDGTLCPVNDIGKAPDQYADDFWIQVATRYKSNPRVMFELANEPHDISDSVWRNGGTVDGHPALGLQQLYDVVRGTGARNLILIDGNNWSTKLSVAITHPLDAWGIIYAPHAYCPTSPQCDDGSLNTDIEPMTETARARFPVIFTEFGSQDVSNVATYNENFIEWAESKHVGWLAYEWAETATYPDTYGIIDDWLTKGPNAGGVPVRNALLAARAADASQPGAGSVPACGYWITGSNGKVMHFGPAGTNRNYGSISPASSSSVVGMTTTPTRGGYWLALANGGVYPFGDARGYGSAYGQIKSSVVGIAATPTGHGYWLALADGGIFPLGDARGYGSAYGRIATKVVGIAPTPTGRGYWLALADGGIFPLGDARGYGSAYGRIASPVVGISPTATGHGYWLALSDGGVFPIGDARGYGSAYGQIATKAVGITSTTTGRGYWLVLADGGIFPIGDAHGYGSAYGRLGSNASGIAS